MQGCLLNALRTLDEVKHIKPAEWTKDDCNTILAASTMHNGNDEEAPFHLYVTPLTPMVILAQSREKQIAEGWSEHEFRFNVNTMTSRELGMSYDWVNSTFLDPSGRPYFGAGQLDSISFLISLETGAGAFTKLDDFGGKIRLQNETGATSLPHVVEKKHDIGSEILFVRFPLRRNDGHLFQGSSTVYVTLENPGRTLRIPFAASLFE